MPKVEIYTNASCFSCVAAKNFLKQRGFGYEEIRIDADPAKYQEMLDRTQRRTVPQIFVDGRHIGGFEELVAAERAGRLAEPRAGDAA
jgi:glutaredoxin 3